MHEQKWYSVDKYDNTLKQRRIFAVIPQGCRAFLLGSQGWCPNFTTVNKL